MMLVFLVLARKSMEGAGGICESEKTCVAVNGRTRGRHRCDSYILLSLPLVSWLGLRVSVKVSVSVRASK